MSLRPLAQFVGDLTASRSNPLDANALSDLQRRVLGA
jgi:hypothetical protein